MALFASATVLLVGGGIARLSAAGVDAVAAPMWLAATVLGLLVSVTSTVAALRRRKPTVDVIAALALGGALAVHEYFAGAMITVMLASGQLLEARAAARARRDLSLLLERAPRFARRLVDGAGR